MDVRLQIVLDPIARPPAAEPASPGGVIGIAAALNTTCAAIATLQAQIRYGLISLDEARARLTSELVYSDLGGKAGKVLSSGG